MKTLLFCILLSLSLSLFMSQFLYKDSIKHKHHKSKGKYVLDQEKPQYSNNNKYFAKILPTGELVLYEILNSLEKDYNVMWSSKQFDNRNKFSLYLHKNGTIELKEKFWDDYYWSRQIIDNGERPYTFNVTDYGKICVLDENEYEMWCNGEYLFCTIS